MPYNTPITWANAAVTASQMNAQIRDNVTWLKAALAQLNVTSDSAKAKITPALCGVRAYKAASQTIATATLTPVNLDTEDFDSDAFHSTSVNNTRFTIPSGMAGYYAIGGHLLFAPNATNSRQGSILLNGITSIAVQTSVVNSASVDTNMSFQTFYQLAVGDYVELAAIQTSGGNLNLQAGAYAPVMWMIRVAST